MLGWCRWALTSEGGLMQPAWWKWVVPCRVCNLSCFCVFSEFKTVKNDWGQFRFF